MGSTPTRDTVERFQFAPEKNFEITFWEKEETEKQNLKHGTVAQLAEAHVSRTWCSRFDSERCYQNLGSGSEMQWG